MTRLATIFSDGSAGAARGALEAAAEFGLAIGGHTAVADLPSAHAEHLRRTLAPRMAARLNVQDSDGTLIVSFAPGLAAGSSAAYADEAAEHQRKAALHIVLPEGGHSTIPEDVRKGVLAWIAEERIATLHVTGPREAEEPGIQQAVHDALVWIFEDEVPSPRATFAGVDRSAAPESLAGVALTCTCGHPRADHDMWGSGPCGECDCKAFILGACPRPTAVDTIERIAAELPSRPLCPPMTTDDALRQVAATGDDDARLLALAELAHRAGSQPTHLAINPANVDAAIAAGLDVQWLPPPPVPPEVWAARDRLLGETDPGPYQMPPPGGWQVDGPVSAPVPDHVVAEHPEYNGIADLGADREDG